MNPTKVADGGAATAVILAGFTLSEVNELVQIVAGCVAIVAGLSAAFYHLFLAPRRAQTKKE